MPYIEPEISNVVVEWLQLVLRILEVPRSNFCSETGYPDSDFSWFSSVPLGEYQDSTLN
jgi:hypothetical protein